MTSELTFTRNIFKNSQYFFRISLYYHHFPTHDTTSSISLYYHHFPSYYTPSPTSDRPIYIDIHYTHGPPIITREFRYTTTIFINNTNANVLHNDTSTIPSYTKQPRFFPEFYDTTIHSINDIHTITQTTP